MTNDIASELAKLHTLMGAEFSRQVERIALMGVFHPLEGEKDIFIAGGEQDNDFCNQLNAARKAVEHGFRVYVLPNPKGIRTADFVFERRGIYKTFDLKTIQGKTSVMTRLQDSVGQSNRVLLNITTDYNGIALARSIKRYFERNLNAVEVLIFKSGKVMSVTRRTLKDSHFIRTFARLYYK